jgi:hypothetical protein
MRGWRWRLEGVAFWKAPFDLGNQKTVVEIARISPPYADHDEPVVTEPKERQNIYC